MSSVAVMSRSVADVYGENAFVYSYGDRRIVTWQRIGLRNLINKVGFWVSPWSRAEFLAF